MCRCVLQGQSDDAGDDGISQADDSERALLALVGSIGRGLWYAGFLAVPAALFWAGVSVFDALHGAYLLLLLGGLLHYTLQLYPAVGLTPYSPTLIPRDRAPFTFCAAIWQRPAVSAPDTTHGDVASMTLSQGCAVICCHTLKLGRCLALTVACLCCRHGWPFHRTLRGLSSVHMHRYIFWYAPRACKCTVRVPCGNRRYIHAKLRIMDHQNLRPQVMLAARVLWRRGIPSWAHPPPAWKPVLEQLGLWQPSVIGSMLPVAATLLLVRLACYSRLLAQPKYRRPFRTQASVCWLICV